MSKPLVIVESPAKAKTISRFLGDDFVVESSVGHIRDLPASAKEIPAAYKDREWATLGVDVDNDFKPLYIVTPEKKRHVTNLKKLVRQASEVYLATDEDREGEAIAWHLREELAPKVPVRRMVFHEITRSAIERALANTRDLDERLVNAQEARRILDRLYGYEVSPVLWKKVMPKLSAGRVQSVATRMVVERERERMAFVSAGWWDLTATTRRADAGDYSGAVDDSGTPFPANLVVLDGQRVASGRDFDSTGSKTSDALLLDEPAARALADALADSTWTVESVEAKPYRQAPPAPFATSSLQQEAGRKLSFTAQRTMQVAQRLYENGYITYMRTDSVNLSETAVQAARRQIRDSYGEAFLPDRPRRYKSKAKNVQEAHEAIRPAGEVFRTPDQLRRELSPEEHRLYDLIWKRTVASQMADAVGERMQVRLSATTADDRTATFAASGRTITFAGFLRAYVEGSDDPEAQLADRESPLPPLEPGTVLALVDLSVDGHETKPPGRFTESSLVKRLEDLGVGRPSTYASIISTVISRGYVWRRGTQLVPSFTAFAVVTLLEQHFPNLVDYAFTARMESDLDDIAGGDAEAIPWLRRFYFGNGRQGLKAAVSERLEHIDAAEINSIPLGSDRDGNPVVARVGRYGPYVMRGDDTASIPDDLPPDELTVERALELLEAGSQERVLGADQETGLPIVARSGRYGPYVQIGQPGTKPIKTESLLKGWDLASVTLEQARQVLSLPRTVGIHPDDGGPVLALNGRYGPYLKWGKETRSLEREEELFEITLDEALRRLAEPKRGRGARSTAPLRELGEDPATGRSMVVKSGRFGPYVTDGETNASLRKGDTVEAITDARAAELLAERRVKLAGSPTSRSTRKKAAKKAAPSKAAKKRG